ncbi:ACP S-malonyltransferase [soil metagenome]
MRALLFSGQGSQYVGMAKDLYESVRSMRTIIDHANDVLGYPLSNIMFDGPEESLRETRYTQPALFVHEAALVDHLREVLHADAVAGHSLGEYSALYAAGVLTFDDALQLVQLRAQLMFDAGTKIPGTMAAVVGMDDLAVRALCDELNGIDGNVIVAANFNSPGQVVISGSAEYLRACMPRFKEAGAKIVKELLVSGAFHSPLLADAQAPLAERMRATTFNDASVDVYCNVSGTAERNGSALRDAAISQLTSPVQWTQTLLSMHAAGITHYTEIGPGKVLQGLVKRSVTATTIDGIDTIVDVQALLSA